jgi:hypothetical protein
VGYYGLTSISCIPTKTAIKYFKRKIRNGKNYANKNKIKKIKSFSKKCSNFIFLKTFYGSNKH